MYAFIMLSAATIASAQPLPTGDAFVGPIQNVMPVVETARSGEMADRDRMSSALTLELHDIWQGAKLRVRGTRLKLKLPI